MRAISGSGESTPIVGFVVRGNNSLNTLVRSVGPTLRVFGLTDAMNDPKLNLMSGSVVLDENDNWAGSATLTEAFAAAGAFPLNAESKDAAIVRGLNPGNYTAYPLPSSGGNGIVLLETYALTATGPNRLVNVSARANAGTGGHTLIVGFAVSGDRPLKVLVRGIGPTLGLLGLKSALADSMLNVYDTSLPEPIAGNDDWESQAEGVDIATLKATTSAAGAFNLPAGSLDSALLLSLKPGTYTANVSSKDGTEGVALAEVYAIEE